MGGCMSGWMTCGRNHEKNQIPKRTHYPSTAAYSESSVESPSEQRDSGRIYMTFIYTLNEYTVWFRRKLAPGLLPYTIVFFFFLVMLFQKNSKEFLDDKKDQ